MFYMVNPSGLPSKRSKNKKSKSRRRNPELLIVNPYSLDEDKEKKRAKMAKRKAKKRKSRSKGRRRKNPLSKRRRNPGLGEIKDEFLGPDLDNVKTAALMAVGGGLALAVGTAAFGSRLGSGNIGKGAVAILSGVVGGVIAKKVGEMLPGALGGFLSAAAVPGAMGAMVLGMWSIAQPMVEPWADTLNAKLGFAGLGSWTKEFDGLGSYYDEFTTGVAPGMAGYFGQPVIAAVDDTCADGNNPFCGVAGYEPLGDIYNSQRLGSFEAEPGFGGFVPETANPRDQQVADVMKHDAGHYGGFEGALWDDPAFD